ncbi:MAG: hypothetical protein AAF757_00945 [Cyanobacteria bacterium P01_D01_bin.116]
MTENKKPKQRDINTEGGNFIEKLFGNYIQGNVYNLLLPSLPKKRIVISSLGILLTLIMFPAYYPLINSLINRNSKIEILDIEGMSEDGVVVTVKNSGRKPGSIGSSRLIVRGLIEREIGFPFDNEMPLNDPRFFIKSGEEKRISLKIMDNWDDVSKEVRPYYKKIIKDKIIPVMDNMNFKRDDLGLSCTLKIEINQSDKVELIQKEIEPQWRCVQALFIFVPPW